MLHRESTAEARFEAVILEALRHILRHQDPTRFLTWARHTIPQLLQLDEAQLALAEERRLAVLLARAIWNATPLPRQGFRIQPLDEPDLRAPCPCGSGDAYGRCCAHASEVPELPPDLIWALLLDEMSERLLRRALEAAAVPSHLLGLVAERWLAQGRPGRSVALLEPLFGEHAPTPLDERFENALSSLCDAYDELYHWKKKRDLLARMTKHPCRALRAAAWQRLSTIHIDEGDFLEAQVAFAQAQRDGPDEPGTALLEITLLAAQHEEDRARNRAVFWRHKLVRAGNDDEEVMAFLRRAAVDPQDALMSSQAAIIDPLLLILREWVQASVDRPLPAYEIEIGSRHAGMKREDNQRLTWNGADADDRAMAGTAPREARLRAPETQHPLESRWRNVFATPKPVSTRLLPLPFEEIWENEDWVTFLVRHPEAADSIEILDDLATAIYVHPSSALPWISRCLLVPVLERAAQILEQIMPPDSRFTIPWSFAENRPALRLLFRLYLYRQERDEELPAAETLRTLLRLNPGDEHGIRADLINHYLRRNENDRALELAGRFPDDRLADLAYGEVLALYRVGEHAAAQRALDRALVRLPRIPHYLTRKRVRQPVSGSANATGDEAQAWLYREAMRDVWEAEPGVLAWLKKHAG